MGILHIRLKAIIGEIERYVEGKEFSELDRKHISAIIKKHRNMEPVAEKDTEIILKDFQEPLSHTRSMLCMKMQMEKYIYVKQKIWYQ